MYLFIFKIGPCYAAKLTSNSLPHPPECWNPTCELLRQIYLLIYLLTVDCFRGLVLFYDTRSHYVHQDAPYLPGAGLKACATIP